MALMIIKTCHACREMKGIPHPSQGRCGVMVIPLPCALWLYLHQQYQDFPHDDSIVCFV